MEELLEAVSEAVSAMVLYAVDSDEKNSKVPDILPGAQVVKQTTDYLVSVNDKSAELWVKFNQPEMKKKMLETGEDIRRATSDILEAATILHDDPFNKPGKKILLRGAKGVMEHMVILLQYGDLYEVTRIVRCCTRISNKKGVLVALDADQSYFGIAAQEVVTQTVELAKMIMKRVKEIDDYQLKKRFEENSAKLRAEIDSLIKATAMVMRGDYGAKDIVTGLSKDVDETLQEIIIIAKLSAKSPFDLSMIEGLELRDDEDLRDMNILISNNFEKLRRAIEAQDGPAAHAILKAVRKQLNDLASLNRNLAKTCEDPLKASRYEAAANAAQYALDNVLPGLADAVDDLLARPGSQPAMKTIQNYLDQLGKATDTWTQACAIPNANEMQVLYENLEMPISQLLSSVTQGDKMMYAAVLDQIRHNVSEQFSIADSVVRNVDDPEKRARMMNASSAAKNNISQMMARLGENAARSMNDPTNMQALSALREAALGVQKACGMLVNTVSTGTPLQVLNAHQAISTQIPAYMQAIKDGDKKAAIAALRAIRTNLNNELNAAKGVARNTTDPAVRERIEFAASNAQRSIDGIMGRLAALTEQALLTPGDAKMMQEIEENMGKAQGISRQLVGATGKDMLVESNIVLNQNLNNLEESAQMTNTSAAVQALKAVIVDMNRQSEVARILADEYLQDDPEQVARVYELADTLATVQPLLVSSAKEALAHPDEDLAFKNLHNDVQKVREASKNLVGAATMAPEEELVLNAADVDQDMARMIARVDAGEVVPVEEITDLIKKISANVKLANRLGAKNKNSLITASANLSKLIGLLVGACRDGAGLSTPNKDKLKGLLEGIRTANRDLAMNTGLLGSSNLEDEVSRANEMLQYQLDFLERAANVGNVEAMVLLEKQIAKSVANEAFLANAVGEQAKDAERKKQIRDALDILAQMSDRLSPLINGYKTQPDDVFMKNDLLAGIQGLRAAADNVASSTSSDPEEKLVNKAMMIGAELGLLENYVAANNAQAANASLSNITQNVGQQVQMCRAMAANSPQKAEVQRVSEKLEANVPLIAAAVKGALAGDKKSIQKLKTLSEQTRALLAQMTALTTAKNGNSNEQVANTANAIKHNVEKLIGPDAEKGIVQVRPGALQQQMDLLYAYAANVNDPDQVKQVADALDDLDLMMKDLVPALRSAQETSNTKEAVRKVADPAQNALSALSRVITSVTPSNDDKIVAYATIAHQNLNQLEAEVKKKNEEGVTSTLKVGKPAIIEVGKGARTAATAVRNQDQKRQLFEMADQLDENSDEVSYSARTALTRPSDANAQKQFSESVQKTRQNIDNAVSLSTQNSEKAISRAAVKMATEIDALANVDVATANNALKEIKGPVHHQFELVKVIIERVEDPERKQKISQSFEKVRKLEPQLIAAGEAVTKNPKDAAARAKLNSVASETKSALAETIAFTSAAPETLLLANANRFDGTMDRFSVAASMGESPQSCESHHAASSLLSEQIVLARAFAVSTSSPQVREAVMKDVAEMEKAREKLPAIVQEVYQKPGDNAANAKLINLLNEVKASHKNIVGQAKVVKIDREKKEKERIQKEKEEKERLEKQRQEEKLKKEQDEVAVAAKAVAQRTQNLKVDNSVEGKLYGTAKGIAALMEKLSKAAAAGDKRGMIEASRDLAVETQNYLAQAKVAAEKCVDPKLKEQILTSSQAAKNWSIQLKIIAAVKAASDENSGSAKEQLVKCAKGLSKAIVATINSAEISALGGTVKA